jgi:hypothetical protein
MHYAVRTRAVDQIGQAGADALMKEIIEDLRKKFGDRMGGPPAAK